MKKTKLILLFCILLNTSCTYFSPSLSKVAAQKNHYAQIDTQAGKNISSATQSYINNAINDLTPKTNTSGQKFFTDQQLQTGYLDLLSASNYNLMALDFFDRSLNLIGGPSDSGTNIAESLTSSNEIIKNIAEVKQLSQVKTEKNLLLKEKELDKKLINYGEQYEAQRNSRIQFWTKWLSIGGISIAGIIGLFVAFPPLLGGIVSFAPSLMHLFSVIPKSSGLNITSAINDFKTKVAASPPEKTYTASEVQQLLEENLSNNLDGGDLKIFNHLKDTTQNVKL